MEFKTDKKKLLEIIEENPDLPIVYIVSNDDLAYGYDSTILFNSRFYISDVWLNNITDEYMDDYNSVLEWYMDYFADNDEYTKLNDDEYEKVIDNYIEENVDHFKAIVISVY